MRKLNLRRVLIRREVRLWADAWNWNELCGLISLWWILRWFVNRSDFSFSSRNETMIGVVTSYGM